MLLKKEFNYIILCTETGFIIIFFKETVILKTSRQTKIIFKGFIHLKLLKGTTRTHEVIQNSHLIDRLKKVNRKVQEEPQAEAAANPRHQ